MGGSGDSGQEDLAYGKGLECAMRLEALERRGDGAGVRAQTAAKSL